MLKVMRHFVLKVMRQFKDYVTLTRKDGYAE